MIKRHLLLLLMATVTLFTAATFFVSLHAFRTQESTMDSMMRSYVLDLAENFSNISSFTGRRMPQHHMPRGQMRFRMLSADPALQSPDAGGILILSGEGKIVSASTGAERLLPLWKQTPPGEEPQETRDEKGDSYYVVVREMEDGLFILAAVSRTFLLSPLTDIWRTWILSAMGMSAVVFLGMLLLWRWLIVPLRGIVERLDIVKWGKERFVSVRSGPFAELEALSSVIGRLAEESFEKEELKKRYVTDLVKVQENAQARLARELHDGALQSTVAAIKRIQLAKESVYEDAYAVFNHLDTAEEVVQTAAKEIRDYCESLSPSWVKLGLVSALEENAGLLTQAYGLEIDVDVEREIMEATARFPAEHVLAMTRIVQEAASNSARHGGARSLQVELRREGASLRFSIQDDGSGFDAEAVTTIDFEELRTMGHRGLANINERVRLLHGVLQVQSHPGEGCRIDVIFPLPSLAESATSLETNWT